MDALISKPSIVKSTDAPAKRNAIVLLSGLDSAVALHWAIPRFGEVVALGFAYGQERAEVDVSQVIAERRGVRWIRGAAIDWPKRDPSAGRDAAGVSRAFVPGRNALLVWLAASRAATLWPGGRASIVVGCNADDAAGFPDCRPEFLHQLSYNVGAGLAGACDVDLVAPWINWLRPDESMHKAAIVRWAASRADPAVLEDVRYAVSCYRGARCGECDACTLRVRAFAEAGVEDGNDAPPALHGGDPSHEPRRA